MSINRRTSLEMIASTLAAFRQSTGVLPSPVSELTAERTLGTWLDKRRREDLNGTLLEQVGERLDAYLAGWRMTEDELWESWARECANFMLRCDREPNPVGETEIERSIGVWYRSQAGTAALGKLRADRLEWLQDHCRFWAPITLQRPKART